MLNFKITTLLFTAICYSRVRCSHGTIHEIKKSYTFGKDVLFDGGNSFKDGIFLYVLCDFDTGNTTNCRVIQTKYPYEEVSHSCDITLEKNDGGPWFGTSLLKKEKAALYWTYRSNRPYDTSIGTIDLKTCKFSRSIDIKGYGGLTFFDLAYKNNLVPYNDGSFDISYPDPRYHPENGEMYKIQIDGDGKLKSKPTSANLERGRYSNTFTVADGSPAKGYVYVNRKPMDFSNNATFYVWLVKPDGARLQLAQYNGFASEISVHNDLINLCHKVDAESHITCNQYDENGNLGFSTIFHTGQNIDFIRIYNLPNGDVLVMYGVKRCKQLVSCHSIFKVTKIRTNGKRIGSLQFEFDIVNMDQIVHPYIYMNESGDYCATVIDWNFRTTSKRVPINLTILSKCFTEDDLKLGEKS